MANDGKDFLKSLRAFSARRVEHYAVMRLIKNSLYIEKFL